ncbi:MAG: UDP-N-acetyl glucosamine 2-epimerase [Prevotella sp.]|nr:UDP-N-acetyl glucosamine 2-epimerase [Prevotella sp.]
MNICIVAGARPNFMKVAPIVRAIVRARSQGRNIDFRLVYAGRSDDSTLEKSLFDDLEIDRPDAFLGVECENLNELTGQVMSAFERYLQENPTDVVIVVDDLASTMATAIVTKKQGITLAHLVAGTRSFDISMPKEINRLVIDGLSDLLFTAGIGSQSTATREGGGQDKVYMVGNILMDTLRYNHARLKAPGFITGEDYLVFTLNRKALLADEENLSRMLEAIVSHAHGMTVYAPLRGKAKDVVSRLLSSMEAEGKDVSSIVMVEPLSYLEFGWLTAHAKGIVTDSGNVAEEATFNSVPCITLNSYTEHIETVKVGTNVLVGEDADALGHYVESMAEGYWKSSAIPDRWDGRSAERIVQILLERR